MTAPSTATGKVYNVGCSQNVSVNELAKKIKALCNSTVDFTFNDSRAGDVKDSLADIQLAKDNLDVDFLVLLDEGLQRTFSWYESVFVNHSSK